MKKILVLVVALLVAFAPMSFAACGICNATGSDSYFKAAGAKLCQGIANAGLGWVELIRQPVIQENKWQGVGQGVVYTVERTGLGVIEVVTALVPGAKIPTMDPSCPLDMASKS